MKDKQVLELTPEETKRWKKICKPIWDKWVGDIEKKGLPGKAILEETQRLAAKYATEYGR
jgi:hypothetical protein